MAVLAQTAVIDPILHDHRKVQHQLTRLWIVRWIDSVRRWPGCYKKPMGLVSHRRRPAVIRQAPPRRLVRPAAMP